MFKLADRVKETSQTTGNGTLSLDGAATGFQTFLSGVGNGGKCTFITSDGTNWEVASGTLTSGSPNTLSRTAILASSNGGSAVSWATGNKNVALVQPAGRLAPVLLDRQSASASSSLDFTGLDSTYDLYFLKLIDLTVATNGAALWLRISIAASFLAANYSYNGTDAIPTPTNTAVGGTGQAQIPLLGDVANSSATSITGEAEITNPSNGTPDKGIQWRAAAFTSGGSYTQRRGAGAYVGAVTAIDGLRVMASSGNLAGGAVELWGSRYA